MSTKIAFSEIWAIILAMWLMANNIHIRLHIGSITNLVGNLIRVYRLGSESY
ncbi:MAG: hypothetical protein GXZ03_01490 [Proteiniphilum sp.]|nr:hypothetical protein [Proteiniphilum sp.]